MHHKVISFLCCLLFFCTTYAVELNWRSTPFDFTNYARSGIDGGAAIYTLPSKDTLKFKIAFVFRSSIFSMPASDITTVNAMIDLLVLGGSGKRNYEQIQKELTQNGIMLDTSLNELGEVVVSCEALTEDFQRVLNIMSDLILAPKFDSNALTLWKQQTKSQFMNLGNANTLGKQMLFINVETARLAFGSEHYLATALMRASPKSTQAVTIANIKKIYSKILNRNGLNVLMAGAYPDHAQPNLTSLITKIPSGNSSILTWLPGRLQQKSSPHHTTSIKSAIIHKSDMTQSQISLRFYYPYMGELNPIEKAQMAILTEIFSATGGVVGNDRFSKAMRADSGLSYSPHAYFKTDVIDPNTNLSVFIMNFQSPNEKVFEAVTLAKKTWDVFIQKGITAHELDRTRSAVMNSMLATDLTVFDKSNIFFNKIIHGKAPSVNPIEETLESLDMQRNFDKINTFLINKFSENNMGTLVIMGNPANDQIEKLKALSVLDFIESQEVNSLLQ